MTTSALPNSIKLKLMKEFARKLSLAEHLETADIGTETTVFSRAIFVILCAVMVFSVIAYGAVDAWAWSLLLILTGLVVILWVGDAWREKEWRINPSALLLPLGGLIALGLFQLLPFHQRADADLLSVPTVSTLSLDPYATRFFVIQLIVYLIFFAAALVFINTRQRLQTVVLTIIIFGGAMAFFGILQRLANPDAIYGLRQPQQAIFFASFINQHHFAALMNMTLGLTLGVLFGRGANKDKTLLLVIAAFLMGIALLLTGSRGGLISFLGVLGFLLVPRLLEKKGGRERGQEPKINSKFLLIIGVFVLVVGLFGAVLMLGGDQSLMRGVGLTSQEELTNGRLHFWGAAWKIFLDHPIIGAGLDAFSAAFTRYDSWNGTFRIERAHNEYLQTLAEGGIIGLICVISFIYLLFRKGLFIVQETSSNYRRSVTNGALAGGLGIIIHSLFDFPLRTPANAFFFLMLAALAVVTIYYPASPKNRKREA